MRPAAERLHSHLTEIPMREPAIPILHNVDAQPRPEIDGIRKALVAQVENPVRWTDTVRAVVGEGAGIMLECGPGRVLGGLIKRIDKAVETIPLQDPEGIRQGLGRVVND
jgi:[acyl-carrier-protein] S-malonyltransferase